MLVVESDGKVQFELVAGHDTVLDKMSPAGANAIISSAGKTYDREGVYNLGVIFNGEEYHFKTEPDEFITSDEPIFKKGFRR